MKKSFRGYNVKEADLYIEQLKNDYEAKIADMQKLVDSLTAENEAYKLKITELENNEKLVSIIKTAQDSPMSITAESLMNGKTE